MGEGCGLYTGAEKLHAQNSRGDRGTKTKIFLSRNCMLKIRPCSAAERQMGLTEFGTQAKPLNYSKKNVVFLTNLEQMFKRMDTNLHTQPKTTQQSVTCAIKNVRFLPDDSCCLNNMSNMIHFRINWRRVNQGFNGPICRSPLV